jgi:tyrosyl-tRNA synthetase
MVHFETVARRLQTQQPLSFLEFNYMVLQGYDFVHLLRSFGCKFQFGGSDQWGNMIVGSDLIHKMQLGDSYVITTPLLTTSSGKKMGKTEQGAVWLDPDWLSDFDYWQFWRNCDDQDCEKLLLAMTDLEPAFIKSYFTNLEPGQINQAKTLLANEQTKMCRGEESQKIAYARAQAIFTGSDENRKEALSRCALSGEPEELLVDFMNRHNLTESKSAAKKLIDQKAVKINDSVVEHVFYKLILQDYRHTSTVLSIGKKKHYLIICP